jgi:hypothetical protein
MASLSPYSRVDALCVALGDGGEPSLLAVLTSVLEGPRWSSTLCLSFLPAAALLSPCAWSWPPAGAQFLCLAGGGAATGLDGGATATAGALAARRAGGAAPAYRIVAGDDAGRLRVWVCRPGGAAPDASEVAAPRAWHGAAVAALAWAPAAAAAAAAPPQLLSLDADGGVALWPAGADASGGAAAPAAAAPAPPPGAAAAAACVAALPAGAAAHAPRWLCGRRDGALAAYDAGARVRWSGRVAPQAAGGVTAVAGAAAAGGAVAFVAGFEDGCVVAGELADGAVAGARLLRAHAAPVRALAVLGRGDAPLALAASAADDGAAAVYRLWPPAPQAAAFSLLAAAHDDCATSVAFAGGGRALLFSGGWGGKVLLHDADEEGQANAAPPSF